jgi:hypothetical protein
MRSQEKRDAQEPRAHHEGRADDGGDRHSVELGKKHDALGPFKNGKSGAGNPKSEARNPKQIQRPKFKAENSRQRGFGFFPI